MDKPRSIEFILYQLPAYIWAIVILALTSYPSIKLPDIGFDPVDKLAHFGVYFILSALVLRAIVKNGPVVKQNQWNKGILISSIFAIFDELHQIPIPGRQGDIMDFLADFLGILFAGLLFKLLYILIQKHRIKNAN